MEPTPQSADEPTPDTSPTGEGAEKVDQPVPLSAPTRTRFWTRNRILWAINGLLLVTTAVIMKVNHDLKQESDRLADVLKQKDDRNKARAKPEHIARDAELEKFLSDRFEIIAGNATFEDARVVGLGEFHFSFKKDDPKEIRAMGFQSMTQLALALQKTAKAGDHVLVEGISPKRGEMRPSFLLHPSLAFIERTPGITASGWDDEDLVKDRNPEGLRERSRKRNETVLFPTVVERAKKQPGRVFVTAGVAHFTDDPRIDTVLKDAEIPYLLLGEKKSMAAAREFGVVRK